MDTYKQMINRSGFSNGKSLPAMLRRHVSESVKGTGVYASAQEAIYPVEGLAVAYGGLLGVAIDIPNFGRTRQSNPSPSINYLVATAVGYKEEPLLL